MLVDERLLVRSWRAQSWSLHIDSLTVRILYLIVSIVESALHEIVDFIGLTFSMTMMKLKLTSFF